MRRAGRRLAWLRTTTFRVTLLHLLLTVAGTAVVYGLAYWSSTRLAAEQITSAIERDAPAGSGGTDWWGGQHRRLC